VVWELAGAENQRAVYTALEAHFEPMATPQWDKVETLADLAPAIERYHTLVGLGRYNDAFVLFGSRLDRATLHRLAAHRKRISWLERLFPHGVAKPAALTNDRDRSHALNALAQSYLFSGQPGQAAPLFRRADDINAQRQDDHSRQNYIANLGNALRDTGALREAGGVLRRALILSRKLEDIRWKAADSLRLLGRLLITQGDRTLGYVALRRSWLLFAELGDLQARGVTSACLAEPALRTGDLVKARALADEAWELAQNRKLERDFIRTAVMQGQVALGSGHLRRAAERLHYALQRARAVNAVEFELPALITIAELELRQNYPAEARARLNEAWKPAERGPYPLHQADAFNVLADIALAEGDKPAAIDAATNAYRAAWCDGPPYAYHWGLVKAKAHLAALGAPEPAMPPFDENKFEPMPEVEINPMDKYWVDPGKLE
jgi:tetratricopeptide (TPR) repeat protein